MWQLMCTVNTPIRWRGALTCGSCVAINVHGSYKNMVEGTPHMWTINVHANYKNMVVNHKIHLKIPACELQHVCSQICHKHIHIMG